MCAKIQHMDTWMDHLTLDLSTPIPKLTVATITGTSPSIHNCCTSSLTLLLRPVTQNTWSSNYSSTHTHTKVYIYRPIFRLSCICCSHSRYLISLAGQPLLMQKAFTRLLSRSFLVLGGVGLLFVLGGVGPRD